MRTSKVMWAIEHVPSGSWQSGDTELKLYHAEYRARRECVNEAFRPVKVVVTLAASIADAEVTDKGRS